MPGFEYSLSAFGNCIDVCPAVFVSFLDQLLLNQRIEVGVEMSEKLRACVEDAYAPTDLGSSIWRFPCSR